VQNKAGDVRFWPKADMSALHMSAIGCKADMTICGVSAFAVAIGGKADMVLCGAYVCFDPKRTLPPARDPLQCVSLIGYDALS